MGASKRDYMNYYDHATLHDVIQKYYSEEEMYSACLGDVKTQYANKDCDTGSKEK